MWRVRGLSRISLSYNVLPLFSADASIYVSFSPSYGSRLSQDGRDLFVIPVRSLLNRLVPLVAGSKQKNRFHRISGRSPYFCREFDGRRIVCRHSRYSWRVCGADAGDGFPLSVLRYSFRTLLLIDKFIDLCYTEKSDGCCFVQRFCWHRATTTKRMATAETALPYRLRR